MIPFIQAAWLSLRETETDDPAFSMLVWAWAHQRMVDMKSLLMVTEEPSSYWQPMVQEKHSAPRSTSEGQLHINKGLPRNPLCN